MDLLSSSMQVISPITDSKYEANENLISLSTFVSQTLILGSSVMQTFFLKFTTSPYLLDIFKI